MSKHKRIMTMIVIAVILLITLVVVLLRSSEEDSSSHSETTNGENSLEMENSIPEMKDFEEIDFPFVEGKSMQSHNGNDDPFYRTLAEERIESEKILRVDNETYPYTGHALYRNQNGDEFIISGFTPCQIVDGVPITTTGIVREENSDKRIHTFTTTMEAENYQKRWDMGQKILAGEKNPEAKGYIIMDGALTQIPFEVKNGEYFFNLKSVAKEFMPSLPFFESIGYVDIPGNDFTFIRVLFDNVDQYTGNANGLDLGKYDFYGWNGQDFKARVKPLENDKCVMNAYDAALMFGWRFFTDGDSLAIVTHPGNVSELVAVLPSTAADGDLGIRTTLEFVDGQCFLNVYSSDNVLLQSTPVSEEELAEMDSE